MDPVREFVPVAIDESTDETAGVEVADLDGDGDLDLVLAEGRHDRVVNRVYVNDGTGRFIGHDLGPRDDASYSALPADVDQDGDLDIVVANDAGYANLVYLNDGHASFEISGEWGEPSWPTRFSTIADLNEDGYPDVVAANRSTQLGRRSAFCLNDGQGRLSNCTELDAGPASGIEVADFDADGHLDIAVPHRDGGASFVFFNDGQAGFSRKVAFGPPDTAASASATGDLDGDGSPDLLVGDASIGLFLYLNDGSGAFDEGLQVQFDALLAPRQIVTGDLNGDGHLDIVVSFFNDRGAVLFNDGTGRAFRQVRFGSRGDTVYGLALGDLDDDGYLDIATARSGAPNVVYFNRPGSGVDIVVASADYSAPVLFFSRSLWTIGPHDVRSGVWRGLVTDEPTGFVRQTEVAIDLIPSQPGSWVGYRTDVRSGVPYCRTSLTLAERTGPGSYVFSEKGYGGSCPDYAGTSKARWDDDGSLHWQMGADGTPFTLARVGSPIPLLDPARVETSRPLLGTWRGQVEVGQSMQGVEFSVTRLDEGEEAGQMLYFSPSPIESQDAAWCPGPVTLIAARPGGDYIFSRGTSGGCGKEEFHVRLSGGRLLMEWYSAGEEQPSTSTALLVRKQ